MTDPEISLTVYSQEEARRNAYLTSQLNGYATNTSSEIEYSGDSTEIIILGEKHDEADKYKQSMLIRAIKPSVILLEGLTNHLYDPVEQTLETQEGRMGDPEEYQAVYNSLIGAEGAHNFLPLLNISDELQIPIVGIDITQRELLEMVFPGFNTNQSVREAVVPYLTSDPRLIQALWLRPDIMNVRNQLMKKMIMKYRSDGTKVVAMVGKLHGDFLFADEIEKLNNCCYIYPSALKGVRMP
jgi:hypothetical protein